LVLFFKKELLPCYSKALAPAATLLPPEQMQRGRCSWKAGGQSQGRLSSIRSFEVFIGHWQVGKASTSAVVHPTEALSARDICTVSMGYVSHHVEPSLSTTTIQPLRAKLAGHIFGDTESPQAESSAALSRGYDCSSGQWLIVLGLDSLIRPLAERLGRLKETSIAFVYCRSRATKVFNGKMNFYRLFVKQLVPNAADRRIRMLDPKVSDPESRLVGRGVLRNLDFGLRSRYPELNKQQRNLQRSNDDQ
jgi:hypothetical protein